MRLLLNPEGEIGAHDVGVVRAAAGAPVIVGCSSVDTELSVSFARQAAEAGAAVVMIAPPRRPEWTRAQLLDHFSRVAAAVYPLPVMVQDAPSFIGVGLDQDFVRDLRSDSPNVLYTKSQSVPAADKTAELVELGGIGVFGGHGALHYLDVLDAGAIGMIPGCEMPASYARIFELHQAGQHDEARDVFTQILAPCRRAVPVARLLHRLLEGDSRRARRDRAARRPRHGADQ